MKGPFGRFSVALGWQVQWGLSRRYTGRPFSSNTQSKCPLQLERLFADLGKSNRIQERDIMDHIVSHHIKTSLRLWSDADLGRTQAFFQFGLACFSGSLFDSYGHKPLIAGGTFCLVLGFCMLSLCTQYYQFFIVHATLIAWGSNLL